MNQKLTTIDHDRSVAGLTYVYPVISRRSGGLSIGINFNTNNACNWRCVYCQVPELTRGTAPKLDFKLLKTELTFFLNELLKGDFFEKFNIPKQQRVIKDIAISGNGEPTSLRDFDKAIKLVGNIATNMGVFPKSDFILITNGSLMNLANVQTGLKIMNDYQGQVWFKLDSATEFGRKSINDSRQSNKKTRENLKTASTLCETSLQTCMMQYLTPEQIKNEQDAYLVLLDELKKEHISIKKILLYTLARPSLQKEAKQLSQWDKNNMLQFAEKIRQQGYLVNVSEPN